MSKVKGFLPPREARTTIHSICLPDTLWAVIERVMRKTGLGRSRAIGLAVQSIGEELEFKAEMGEHYIRHGRYDLNKTKFQ